MEIIRNEGKQLEGPGMSVGITGGAGFIGTHLTALLRDQGYKVVIFTRSAKRPPEGSITYAHWDPEKQECDTTALADLNVVVHLAGAGIAEKRLTEKRKKEIIGSRTQSTAFLLAQLKAHAPRCKTLVAASATGFYGPDNGGRAFTESAPPATDFLATTCRLWEDETLKAASLFRTVILRIGIVLGKEGGAYPSLAKPLSFGIMPILGNGKQIVSWIAVQDLARLFLHSIQDPGLSGVYNGVAPVPVTHRQLMHTLHKVKGGLAIPAPVPAFMLRLILGEMADEVLKSCTVSADKTLASGFNFDYPDLAEALAILK